MIFSEIYIGGLELCNFVYEITYIICPLLIQAEHIIQRLALHELIDPRIGEAYDTYEVYHMAKAAYSCVQRKPEMRPSMSQVRIHISIHDMFSCLYSCSNNMWSIFLCNILISLVIFLSISFLTYLMHFFSTIHHYLSTYAHVRMYLGLCILINDVILCNSNPQDYKKPR